MTYFRDLSRYSYLREETVAAETVAAEGAYFAEFEPAYHRVNVGWLSGKHEYTSGPSPVEFLARLLDILSRQKINLTRGFHCCELCPYQERQAGLLAVEHKGAMVRLGNGEIRVPGAPKEVFAAPTLIAHYVERHHYLPPTSFVEAVLRCPEGWMSGPDAPGVPKSATRCDYRNRRRRA
ncbi:hypothetical protein ACIQF6_20360 [Kitasatospora sp. NPDC092948]|uniref:DUF7919 family protein n=1 Tax=Kitasatospora sp. NPDC092948 TaxID=3364088 RepID=UPI0037FE7195